MIPLWKNVARVAIALSGVFFLPLCLQPEHCQANELAVGERAKVEGPISIPLNGLENFNYLFQEQILGLRNFQALKHPQLLRYAYQPTRSVFSQIADNKPWWGMQGAFIFGSGEKSMLGPAEESRFILNPYLLVALAPWTAEIWNLEKLTEEDIARPDFPYCWNPVQLSISPRLKQMDVTYDVSGFEKTLKLFESRLKDTARNRDFGLIAYNARDFGYEYIYVPIDKSTNIDNLNRMSEPVAIEQYIHCGNTCGCPEGCNNMSPARPPFDHFRFKDLPATVKALLWKQKPSSKDAPPDMTVTITLN